MELLELRKRLHPHRMFRRGGRTETCRCCGFEWSVSLTAEWPYGYLCPACSRAMEERL